MPNLSSTNIHDCGRITAEDRGDGSHSWLSVKVMGEGPIASFALHDIPPVLARMYAEAVNAVNEAWEEDDAA